MGGAHLPIRDMQREKKKKNATGSAAPTPWCCHGRVSPGWRRHPWGKPGGGSWWHCRWHRGCPPARDTPGARGSRGVTCPARSVPRLFGVHRLGGGEAFRGCAGAQGSSEPWEGRMQLLGISAAGLGLSFYPPFLLSSRNSTWKSDPTESKDSPCNLAALPSTGRNPSSTRGKAGLLFPYAPETEPPQNIRIRVLDNSLPGAGDGRQAAASGAPVLPGQGWTDSQNLGTL